MASLEYCCLSGSVRPAHSSYAAFYAMAQVCREAESAAYIKAVAADMKKSLVHPLSLNDSVAKCARNIDTACTVNYNTQSRHLVVLIAE